MRHAFVSEIERMLSRETLITAPALFCLYYYQGFILGAALVSSFYIDQDCDVGLCLVSYISALLFPLVGMLSFLAGDRLGSIYGTIRTFEIGCLWWAVWMLAGNIFTNLETVNYCLKMASIGGLIALSNAPHLLESSLLTCQPFGVVLTGGICIFGACRGGQFVWKISLLTTGPFVWSTVLCVSALCIVHIYLSNDRLKPRNLNTDWFGLVFGAIGLGFINLTAGITRRTSPFDQRNIALFLSLCLYWSVYALVEMKYAGKHALFPAVLWPDIILYSVLILVCTHTILQSMFGTHASRV